MERENHCKLRRTFISSHFSNSTVNYTLRSDFSAHAHLMTFEELCLGVPKRSYILKFIAMATRGEPSKDEHFCELFDMSNFGAWKRNISFYLMFTHVKTKITTQPSNLSSRVSLWLSKTPLLSKIHSDGEPWRTVELWKSTETRRKVADS